jgi:hypothetical protein
LRVGTLDCACPDIRSRNVTIGLCGVESSNLLSCLFQHPITPILHISRQGVLPILSLGDFDIRDDLVFGGDCASILVKQVTTFRLLLGPIVSDQALNVVGNRSAVGLAVFLWIDKSAKLYQMSNGIQIDGMGLTTKPQGFQRDSASSRKWIENFGRISLRVWMQELMGGSD